MAKGSNAPQVAFILGLSWHLDSDSGLGSMHPLCACTAHLSPCLLLLLSMANEWVILNNHKNNSNNIEESTLGSLRINSSSMALQLPFEHDKR